MPGSSTILLLSLVAIVSPANPALDAVAAAGTGCLLGFCPVPVREGPPPGLMFLSVGLVGVGVAGLWQRRSRAGS